jgi:hypothetical protein
MDSPATPGTARIPVLYIGSWGRSGSTLLDLMLGQLPGYLSLGEVRYLFERGLQERQRCGCGTPLPDCPFWRAVLEEAYGADWLQAGWVADTVARWRRVDGLARLPRLAAGPRSGGFARELQAYRGALARLYAAVHKVSGARVLVDSSKYAAYGLILAGVPGIDLRLLHLVRDSRAVAHSWTRRKRMPEVTAEERYMPRKGAVRSAFYWSLENIGLELLHRPASAAHVLRYEDLTANPARALAALTEALALRAPGGGLPHARLSLGESHTVAGNPVRFAKGEITIHPDTEWRTALAPGSRRVVTLLTWPLLARYGFLPGHREPAPGV